MVYVPPIGEVICHPDVSEWYLSEEHTLRFLRGAAIQFVLVDYAEDPNQADNHAAFQNILDLGSAALTAVEPYVAQYCNEMLGTYDAAERPDVKIEHPSDVWKYVQFGSELQVSRRAEEDDEDGIYFSLGCSCAWEPEHGLEMVLRDGLAFTKVGPYDGRRTNTDTYADPRLKGCVYRSFR